jgi:hypothetical protein
MSTFDRQWFKDVRAVLDNANGLKDAPPQDAVTAGIVKPVAPKESEEPKDWYTEISFWQENVYAPAMSSCPKHALPNCAVCRINDSVEMPCDVAPFDAPESDGA